MRLDAEGAGASKMGSRASKGWYGALAEGLLVVFLVLLTTAVGYYHLFLQPLPNDFEPTPGSGPSLVIAVMVATGRGFVEPSERNGDPKFYSGAPELTRFLRQEIPSLSPEQVPADLPVTDEAVTWVSSLDKYLYCAIGLLWQLFGISWNVVRAFRIALSVVMVVAVFGLMRLGMGRVVSIIGAALLAVSPALLRYSLVARDFSKGAFILVVLLILGYLVKRPVRRSVFLALAAFMGLIIGIGVGFRTDLLACLPPAFFVLAFCERPHPGRAVGQRMAAMALLALAFAIAVQPVYKGYPTGSLLPYEMDIGFATNSDDSTGVGRASYERLYVNDDDFLVGLLEGYHIRVHPHLESRTTIADSMLFLMGVLPLFPGDILTRAYASTRWVIRGGDFLASLSRSSAVKNFTGGLMGALSQGPYLVAGAAVVLLLIALRNLRWAWTTFLLLLYFGGTLSIQAQWRHAFQMSFVPIWIVGFLLDKAVYGCRQAALLGVRGEFGQFLLSPEQRWRPPVRRALLFAGGVAALLAIPLCLAEMYQFVRVGGLVKQYSAAALTPVAVEPHPLHNWVLFQRTAQMPPDSGVENGRRQRDEYWMAEFAPSRQWRPVWLQYLTERGVAQSSHGLWMYPSRASDSGNVKYFFPVVERTNVQIGGWYVFAGIAVPQDQAGDFKGLYRVSNETDFPFFMNVSLPADLASFRRCQLLWGGLPPEVNAWATRYWLWPYPQFQVPPVNNIAAQPDSSQEAESRQSALASDPQNPLLRLGLAAALEAKGDRAAALQAYREIIAASPRIFVTYQYLDALLKRQGDLNARIALWRDIAREHPDIPLPYCHLALALEDKQDLEGAIEAYRRAVELGPDAVETLRCLGRLLKGKNDVDGAIDAYQRILEINPADPNATHTLGQLFAQKAAT